MPSCAYCQREFRPGLSWGNVNFCRAGFLTDYIRDHPGKSGWEISKATGLLYSDVAKALTKAREWELVAWDVEERDSGGQRFRYRLAPGANEVIAQWKEQGRL